MWAFTCCTHDSGSPEGEDKPSSSAYQVTIVFNPGQVGDQGYADCIMGCLSHLEAYADATFFSYTTKLETAEAVKQWGANRQNPFWGGNYQHRLLILTDASQAQWLNEITSDGNDEILMLNTPQTLVDSLAEARWGNHIHALNISVASEMKRYCQFVQQNTQEENFSKAKVYIIQENAEDEVADSILTTINSYTTREKETEIKPVLLQISSSGGDNDSTYDYTQATKNAIDFAIFYYALIEADNEVVSYTIVNNGIYGGGFKTAQEFLGKEYNRTLFMDAEVNGANQQKYIKRLYDQAIIAWVKQWTIQQALPRIIWHGEWDGYTNSNF